MPINKIWHAATIAALAAVLTAAQSIPATAAGFSVTPLDSNLFSVNGNPADGELIDAWGVAFSPTSPFWINDNGTGLSTLYNSTGVKEGLVVTIPPPKGKPGPSAPDGMVFNATSDFQITVNGNSTPAAFIFATEDGTISAWAGGTEATLVYDGSKNHTVFKGLALLSTTNGNFLLATDFDHAAIDVFNGQFKLVDTLTNLNVPTNYAPFNVAVLNGVIYVTFALQNKFKHDDLAGPGRGFVETLSLDGPPVFQPLINRTDLNAPWGVAIAPTSFGTLAGDLLVGNFGDGTIHAYDATTGAEVGPLLNTTGAPIFIDGLWELTPGNDHSAGSSQNIYFTAGPNAETNGIFGVIAASVPNT